MPAFQPTADQFRAFRDDPHDGMICQVNLVKFRAKAEYQPGDPEHGETVSGGVAYQRYCRAFAEAAKDVGGECLLMADAERYFIGGGDWDGVLIMKFPNRQAFIATLNHANYEDMSRHRDAGLLCQDLITTRPMIVAGSEV
ncbi:MAG: DUF1330 domain-containing protein [Pseudomonadota bacterium]